MKATTIEPKGEAIEIDQALIKSAKADLVNKSVNIVISLQLDESVLGLRERLAFLASDKQPVQITIQPLQLKLINTDNLPLEVS